MRGFPMLFFIFFHGTDDSSASEIFFRQTVQVRVKMAFNLFFSFPKKSQINSVSGKAGSESDCK